MYLELFCDLAAVNTTQSLLLCFVDIWIQKRSYYPEEQTYKKGDHFNNTYTVDI